MTSYLPGRKAILSYIRPERPSNLPPFKYQPLATNHIRLLRVTKQLPDLQYDLKDFLEDTCPSYHAVSYAWGCEKSISHIAINGQNLPITPHLQAGILAIHSHVEVSWLWIDTICINQADSDEKAVQVAMMWKIYANASSVVVWLGQDKQLGAREASRLRKMLETTISDFGYGDDIDSVARETLLQQLRVRKLWPSLRKIYTQPWFGRLWTLQEVVLARKAVCLQGAEIFELGHLVAFAEIFAVTIRMISLPDNDRLRLCAQIRFLRHFNQSPQLDDGISDLFSAVRTREAREPVDRIYAVLGILDDESRSRIHVNYSDEYKTNYWRVYAEAVQILLPVYGESILQTISTSDRLPGLPSWCPNLSRSPGGIILGERHFSAGIASADDSRQSDNQARISASGNPMSILMPGFQTDRVTDTVDLSRVVTGWPDEKVLNYSMFKPVAYECIKNLKEASVFDSVRNRLGHTLICGATHLPDMYEIYMAQHHFELYLKMVQNETLASILLRQRRHPVDYSFYKHEAITRWLGRCFFITENGRIGVGPKDIMRGDYVCVIKDFRYPYVLREQPDGETYSILGQSYVDGIMNGEALKSPAFEANGWTEFVVV